LSPEGGRVVRPGRMNEKKWRLIDDDIVVSLIDNFEMEWWSNGVME
jgi:hypothetical protein